VIRGDSNLSVSIISQERWGGEALAKAALIEFLRKVGLVTKRTAVAVELGVGRQANRVDLAVIGEATHFYEIKSRRDTLCRLEAQVAAYETVGDFISVVVASKHLNAVLSRVDSHVGVLEILDFGGRTKVVPIRDPLPSPAWSTEAALALLPSEEIRHRLLGKLAPRRRSDVVSLALELSRDDVQSEVRRFLKSRYLPSTRNFLGRVARRKVTVDDLQTLHVWGRKLQVGEPIRSGFREEADPHGESYLTHVGRCFGPVPDEVQRLLAG
jgi:hypothetical protein